MSDLRISGRGRVDHARPVRFTFDGKTFTGFEGDTVASALLANGQHLMGRGFKYHRPRGVVTAGSEEPNALIGFAGQRVIQDTIREKLPEGFQRAEYLPDHGMLDMVVERKDLRQTLGRLVGYLMPEKAAA